MRESLTDSTVVVIGGSSGIGLATAQLAADAGARVVIAGRDEARLDRALESLGAAAVGVVCDVGDESSVAALFEQVGDVDHVACLAGVHGGGPVVSTPVSEYQAPVDSRFWGPVHVAKYASPRMRGGSITLCTGVAVGRPRAGSGMMAAACGGAEVFALAMAVELAPIRVNVIRPGLVDTPMLDRMVGDHREQFLASQAKRIPLGRVARPEDIADAITFLMTNTYVTGITLTVDGGVSLI